VAKNEFYINIVNQIVNKLEKKWNTLKKRYYICGTI